MKTNELEIQNFFGKPDWDGVYPQLSSLKFYNQARNYWQNINANKLNEGLKPTRGKVNELTMFYLWLYLCIERPWEKKWKGNFTQKKADEIWDKFCDLSDQLNIFNELNPPDPRSLKKYIKRDDFQKVVTLASMDPFVFKKITEIFTTLCKPLKKLSYYMDDLKLNFKFADYIRSQKHVKKRNLMRTLGINKETCNLLLTEAEDQGFIKTQRCPHNSIWIIYIGFQS